MRENQVTEVLGRSLESGGEGGLATSTMVGVNRPGFRECHHGQYLQSSPAQAPTSAL